MYDVIVVGGGVVGLSTAYHLVASGARALLLDREDAGRATQAGAGIIASESNSGESEAWFNFALAAIGYYPTLIERLYADGTADTGYAPTSQLIIAASEDEDMAFGRARQRIFDRQRQRSRPAPQDLQEIDSDAACALFPLLGPVRGAILYRNAARVDGRLLAAALRQAAEAHGLSIRTASVEQLALRDNGVSGVVAAGETIAAGSVVIAAGAWSARLADQLGVALPIQPSRGQIIHLKLADKATGGWPIVSGFRGHYIVPWPDGRIVVGATRETGTGFAAHTTAAGIHEVLGEALRVAPGLAAASIADIRVGLRPMTADNLPVLGAAPSVRGVYLAAGHGATGLQLGPYSGKLIADLILGRPVETNLAPFSATRFSGTGYI
jgi:D-amino-acid dehydrogenase